MNNCIILFVDDNLSDNDLLFLDKYEPKRLFESLSNISNISQIYFSVPQDYSGELSNLENTFVRKENQDVQAWKEIFKSTNSDNLIKVYADSSFINEKIISEMLTVHIENLAEITYSENLPAGITCEIYSKELIDSIPDSDQKMLSLDKVVKSNINQFDVELFYKNPDIRDKRLTFRASDKRSNKVMQNIYAIENQFPAYEQLKTIIDSNPEILYVGPSYLEIELTGKSELETIYSYKKLLTESRSDIDVLAYSKILKDMHEFELPYSICLGGSGDPLMHEKFYEILDLTLAEKVIKNIVIETDGFPIDENFIQYVEQKNDSRIKIIIEMNGYNQETYQEIHNKDCFEKVEKNILKLKEVFNDNDNENIYLQIMKINETEKFLDKYYDYWEPKKIPIILQKQNTYLGLLEDKRYYDLSPLERTPCWHLQRDLFIFSNGNVSFCKQDINGKFMSESTSSHSIKKIWQSRKDLFLSNYNGKLSKEPDCLLCDEWYTFNL